MTSEPTSSASLMWDCVSQQEFYWHCCTLCGVTHWTKWIYELRNHSRGVMISYHGSAGAFVAIKKKKNTDLDLWKAAITELGCITPLFFLIHLKAYFFRAVNILIKPQKHPKDVHAQSVMNNVHIKYTYYWLLPASCRESLQNKQRAMDAFGVDFHFVRHFN